MTTGTAIPHTRSSNVSRPGLRRRVPDQELPYDDESPTGRSNVQLTPPPPVDTTPRDLGTGLVAPAAAIGHRRPRDPKAVSTTFAREAGRAVDGSDGRFHPVPRAAAAVVTRALLEVVCGLRPAAQLAGWTTPQLLAELTRVSGTVTTRRRYVVRSIRVSEPRPGVAEVVAVVARDDRAAAIALRMESSGGRWRVTRFAMG